MNQAPAEQKRHNDSNSNNDTVSRGWEMNDMSIGEDITANAVMTWITKKT